MVTNPIVTRYSGIVNMNYNILFVVFKSLYKKAREFKGFGGENFRKIFLERYFE